MPATATMAGPEMRLKMWATQRPAAQKIRLQKVTDHHPAVSLVGILHGVAAQQLVLAQHTGHPREIVSFLRLGHRVIVGEVHVVRIRDIEWLHQLSGSNSIKLWSKSSGRGLSGLYRSSPSFQPVFLASLLSAMVGARCWVSVG